MTEAACPACRVPVEDTQRVGPVSVDLEPCGHQVDDQLYRDLFAE